MSEADQTDPIMIEIGGKQLEIRVDVLVMRRLRKYDPPIDVRRLVDPTDREFGGLVGRMNDDPEITVNIAFEATRHNTDAPDAETFAEGLGGDRLDELTQKVLEALVRFIPSRENREAHLAILAKINQVHGQMIAEGVASLDKPETDKAIRNALSGSIRDGSTAASSSSAASSDSTPTDPGPSES